jgi:hypothetical protein
VREGGEVGAEGVCGVEEGGVKTTKADFEYFKRRYLFHLAEFGISDYEIRFKHEDIDDAYAATNPNVECRYVVVGLSTNWANSDGLKVTKAALDNTARHEVLHLLPLKLGRLAEGMYAKDLVNEAEEELIRTLETYLDRKATGK